MPRLGRKNGQVPDNEKSVKVQISLKRYQVEFLMKKNRSPSQLLQSEIDRLIREDEKG